MPGAYLLRNWEALNNAQNLSGAFLNSLRNATLLTVVSLLVCSLAGYGFEIYHSKAKDRLMGIILLAMMVPFAATIVPLFRMVAGMGLLNSTLGFMLPMISTPFLIMLFRQSARSFPHDIIEAARIEGLNEVQIFFRMFIPTMKSTYSAAMTIVFMNGWNAFLWPRVIMMTNDSVTMPMLISNLIAGYVTDFGVLMLAVLITTIPTITVFFVMQRHFAEGIVGAVK
jgi:lactose/L-arabinose transport system permease protein